MNEWFTWKIRRDNMKYQRFSIAKYKWKDIIYSSYANIDNSYDERWAKIYIPNLTKIQAKAALFGGTLSFKYEGQEYKFKLPSKAGKFVDFFVK